MFSEKKNSQSYRGRAAGQERGEGLYAERERLEKKKKEKTFCFVFLFFFLIGKNILFLFVCEKGVMDFKNVTPERKSCARHVILISI